MRGLVKGDNTFVPTVPLRVAVRNGVDVAALLLTERGRVRGDGDIVFHGAPAHPSGAVRLAVGEDGTVWLEAGLTAIEEGISRVLVVTSTEIGALRDVDGLSVEVFAPDGTAVVRYDVTDAGGETAMVLAELYRRSGGWKFRAVGQGYLDGLEGLAADHGVDVAEEPPPATPVTAPPAVVTPPAAAAPDFAPPPAPAPAVAVPPSVPGLRPPDRTFGTVFEPHTLSGRHNQVITVEDLPPGPVLVELAVERDGYTGLWPLDHRNKEGDYLVNSGEDDFQGRVLTTVPGNGRLRLKLQADRPWRMRILPLAAARHLTEDALEGRGPDVLLHTGGVADIAFHYRGKENFIVYVLDLTEHDDPATLPEPDGPLVNEIGRHRETVPLPEGPLLVQLQLADGPWRARLKRLQQHSGRTDGDGPVKLPEPRGAQGWLRRGRR
ncbi:MULTISPECIES: TerD family protein [unclassified Streptomyces]|uniref:TerD family protein n=1 Tax=unclassified Streptomyces TaxID=2593676 RepID=UPI0035DB7BDD